MPVWVSLMTVAWDVCHLDAVGIQAIIVDEAFSHDQSLRWTAGFDVYLALEALETMAIRIQQVLIEGDAVGVHCGTRFWHPIALGDELRVNSAYASMSARRWRLRSTI